MRKSDLQPAIGKAARAARKRRGLTLQQAADALGVSVIYYTHIERGHIIPSIVLLAGMMSILKMRAVVLGS